MKEKVSVTKLIEAIQDRNLGVSSTEILKEAKIWDQTVFEEWAEETLGQEVLLTKEELILYEKLKKSGELDALLQAEALDEVRALSDQEIHQAIEQLKSSTETIEKQSELLRVQQDAVASLVQMNGKQRKSRVDADGAVMRGWAGEGERISGAVDELAATLADLVKEIEAQTAMSDGTLTQHAVETLRSDDKVLASLQNLSGALTAGPVKDNGPSERIKILCASLIKYTVEAIRIRLDRVYLEGLEGALGSSEDSDTIQTDELVALKAEVESLYSEILPVAQMSAEQRYLQVALKAIQAQTGQGVERSRKITQYISECMTFLTQRLEGLTNSAAGYREHTATLSSVVALLKAETEAARALPPPTNNRPQPPPSPIKRRNSRLVSATRQQRPLMHRRSSSMSFDDNTPAEQQLLLALGVNLPPLSSGSNTIPAADLHRHLNSTVTDRQGKLTAHVSTLQAATESVLAEHMGDAFTTLQLLRDSLLSETSGKKVRLEDEEVKAAIKGLEAEVEEVRSALGGVDLEQLRGRNAERDAFVERWGG